MNRQRAKQIRSIKMQGRGYKPNRFKRPPSARMVRKFRAKRITLRMLKKQGST